MGADITAIENEEKNLILGDCKYTRKGKRFGIITYDTRKNSRAYIFNAGGKRATYYFQYGRIKKRALR